MSTINVPRDKEPNSTHEMSEWTSTICAPAGTDRFYDLRKCKTCGAEEIKGNGHFMDEDLLEKCEC